MPAGSKRSRGCNGFGLIRSSFIRSIASGPVDDARSFDRSQLGDDSVYPDADIVAKEAAIRDAFNPICGTFFVPTTLTVYCDATWSRWIRLPQHNPYKERPNRPVTVSAITMDGYVFTPDDMLSPDHLRIYPDGRLFRTNGLWYSSSGFYEQAIEVTYTVGWASVPPRITEAALILACSDLVPSDIPARATTYENIMLTYAGPAPHWYGIPKVDSTLAQYRETDVVAL